MILVCVLLVVPLGCAVVAARRSADRSAPGVRDLHTPGDQPPFNDARFIARHTAR